MMLKSMSFPLTVHLYGHLSFTAAYSLKSEKDWPVDFAKLWSRESDNLLTDYCFVIEIFDKFSFSGIFRECLNHLNEA